MRCILQEGYHCMFYQHRRLRVKDTLLDMRMTLTPADKLSSLKVIIASMPVPLDRLTYSQVQFQTYNRRIRKEKKKSPSCTRDTKFMKALSDGTTQGATVTAEHVWRATSIYLIWNLLRWGSHGRRVFLSQSQTIIELQTLRQWKSTASLPVPYRTS